MSYLATPLSSGTGILRSVMFGPQSFPFFLGSGASFVCVDTWRSVSVDTVLRHLRVLKHRKVDVSLPPSMLEDIADARDTYAVVSPFAYMT